jgi:hypothetical protein
MTPGLLGRRGVVENAIEIGVSPEAVFDYCTDVLREPEWNPKLLEVEKLTEGPIGLGTRFRIRLDGVGCPSIGITLISKMSWPVQPHLIASAGKVDDCSSSAASTMDTIEMEARA